MAPASRIRTTPSRTAQGYLVLAVTLAGISTIFTEAQGDIGGVQKAAADPRATIVEIRGVQLLTATVVVDTALAVRGKDAAVLDCGGLPTAFTVRSAELRLEGVVLQNCSSQAIILRPLPGGGQSSLVASNVSFAGHHGNQGFVIAAYGPRASVSLRNTIFTNNIGNLSQQQMTVPLKCSNTTRSNKADTSLAEEPHACFAPEVPSSVVYLQQSNMTVTGISSFKNNSAGAVISAKGGQGTTVNLGSGTIVRNNTAGWILLADSWRYDASGQLILSAPHVRLFADPSAASGRRVEQKHDVDLRDAKPYSTLDFGRDLPTTRADIARLSSREPMQVNASVLQALPKGVAPMALKMEGVDMSGNVVEGGLLWLRLVQASLKRVAAYENIGGLGVISGRSGRLAARIAPSVLEGNGLECDPPVYDALIRVVGPLSFNMTGCTLKDNIHPTGSLLRITGGLAPSSIGDCNFTSNAVTSVVRFEGRSWATNASEWLWRGDSVARAGGFQKKSTSMKLYRSLEATKYDDMEKQSDAVWEAVFFMSGSQLRSNLVQHAVLMLYGNQTESLNEVTARAVLNQPKDGEPVQSYLFNAWVERSLFSKNTLLDSSTLEQIRNATSTAILPATGNGASLAAESLQGFLQERGAPSAWLVNGVTSNTNSISNPLNLGLQKGDVAPQKIMSLCPLRMGPNAPVTCESVAPDFRGPSVFWGYHGLLVAQNVTIEKNKGFPFALRHEAGWLVHLQDITLRDQAVSSNLLEVMYADPVIKGLVVENNNASQELIFVHDTRLALLEATFFNNSVPLPDTKGSGKSILHVKNAERMTFQDATFTANNAELLVHFENGYSFTHPIQNIRLTNNNSSGMFFEGAGPKYDGDHVTLDDITIQGNVLQTLDLLNKAATGALAFKGITSEFVECFSIEIGNSIIADNWARETISSAENGTGIHQLQGGGLLILPIEKERDTQNDPSYLKQLTITIRNVAFINNTAAEGAGLYTNWPANITNCTFRANNASHAGGAIFAQSPQQAPSGRWLLNFTNCRIQNNTSSFGGGLCCWNCRAAISNTTLERNLALHTLKDWAAVLNDKMVGKINSKLYVEGVGGAVAAVFDSSKSFVVIANDTILQRNAAQRLGGGVYMFSEVVADSRWDPNKEFGFEGGTVRPCGVTFRGGENEAVLGGKLIAWKGKAAYTACCSSSKGGPLTCSNNSLPQECSASWGMGNTSAKLSATLPTQVLAFNTSCLEEVKPLSEDTALPAAGAVATQSPADQWFEPGKPVWTELDRCILGVSNASDPSTRSRYNTSQFPWQVARLFSGGQLNITAVVLNADQNVIDVTSPDQPQLLQLVNHSDQMASRAAAVDVTTWAADPEVLKPNSLKLEQTNPKLFVIGNLNSTLNVTAKFVNLALQPVDPPTQNVDYSFDLKTEDNNRLLQQISKIEIKVTLLRCTSGQHETVSRCIRCSDGTYSMNPSSPYGCLPCPDEGATCSQGHFVPTPGFFQRDPWLPHVVPCPLTKACNSRFNPWAMRMQLERLKALQPQGQQQQARRRKLMAPWLGADTTTAGSSGHKSRGLLQADGGRELPAANVTEDPECGMLAAALQAAKSSCEDHSNRRSRSTSGSGGSTQLTSRCNILPEGPANEVDRTCVLLAMQRYLAGAFTDMEEQKLVLSYRSELLPSWQQMQCQEGYTGDLCGTCMPGLTPEAAAAVAQATGVRPSEDDMEGYGRIGFRCVACRSFGLEIVVLLAVFFAQTIYIAVGVMLQMEAAQKVLLDRGSSMVLWRPWSTVNDDTALAGAANAEEQDLPPKLTLPAQGKGGHKGTEDYLQENLVAGSEVQRKEGDKGQISMPQCSYPTLAGSTTPAVDLEAPLESSEPEYPRRNMASKPSFWSPFIWGRSLKKFSSTRSLRRRNTGGSSPKEDAPATSLANGGGADVYGGTGGSGGMGEMLPDAAEDSCKQQVDQGQVQAGAATGGGREQPLWGRQLPKLEGNLEIEGTDGVEKGGGVGFADLDKTVGAGDRGELTVKGVHAFEKQLLVNKLMAIWKVLTDYLQVLFILQYLRWARLLPSAFLSLQSTSSVATSSFNLANLDCFIPGDPETKAIIRMLFNSLVLPAALFLWALLALLAVWALGRFSLTTRRWLSHPTFQAKHRVVRSLAHALNNVVLTVATFAQTAPELPPLREFLAKRLTVSCVVLAFTLYQPFTSTMLLILQCQHLEGPVSPVEEYYNDSHREWLQAYPEALGKANSSMAGLWGKPASVWENQKLWGQEYSVQCFQGPHRYLAYALAVPGLVVVGLGLPLASAWLLAANMKRLYIDLRFAEKFSFLYADYKSRHCFWGSTVMVRKLLLLVVAICMAMAAGDDIMVTQLQCLTCTLLLLLFLALHLWVRPYRHTLINRIDAMCHLATTMTYGLVMYLTLEPNSRAFVIGGNADADPGALAKALFATIAAINIAVLVYILFHTARLVYKVLKQMPRVQQWERRLASYGGPLGCTWCPCMSAQGS